MSRTTTPSTIVITGVTRGLGRALVDEFVRLGHKVVGCARTQRGIEELTSRYPAHDFQVLNVASNAEVARWAAAVVAEHGPPDFLLNNAAVINVKAPLCEVTDRDFSEAIDINIKGPVNVARHFAPVMARRRNGVIVNFCSRWSEAFERNMAPYCATKWALVALTQVLAEELKPKGVAVVGFNPGVVRTDMLLRYLGDVASAQLQEYPTPEEWATVAVPRIVQFGLRDTGKLIHLRCARQAQMEMVP